MIDRGVTVKDLEQGQVDRGDGVRHGGASGVADLAADVEDRGAVAFLGRALLQAAKDANNPVMHRKPSCTGGRQATPARHEVPLCSSGPGDTTYIGRLDAVPLCLPFLSAGHIRPIGEDWRPGRRKPRRRVMERTLAGLPKCRGLLVPYDQSMSRTSWD